MRPPVSSARFTLFCCPVCNRDLALTDRRLTCANGHSFDLAKSGYVNLARPRKRAPAAGGDTRPQFEARARFLAKGHFDFIAETIAAHAGESSAILDVGCGTGFHLAGVVERLATPSGTGIDLSKDAAAWCARHHPEMTFAVADIWHRWPIRGGSIDLVMSIFAPKNFGEMARVLRPSGMLALAFPGEGHLQELRRALNLLGLPADKASAYAARMADSFSAPVQQRVVRRIALQRSDIEDAIMMGPNARHLTSLERNRVPRSMVATVDVAFLFARRAST
ncbi:MAG TPA: methyltransferase domain-containing protein [Dongiaceae bacterium]|nr:methyltransferase domain-containing protein [Dongiaceae bacterium]